MIYTNGTICPPDIKLQELKNEKNIRIHHNIWKIIEKCPKLVNKLEELKIQYNCQPAYGWTSVEALEFGDALIRKTQRFLVIVVPSTLPQ